MSSHGVRNLGRHFQHGVGFTRNPQPAKKLLRRVPGESRNGENVWPAFARRSPFPVGKAMPPVYGQLARSPAIWKTITATCRFRVTGSRSKLYMLQTRNGKRTGPAAVRIAVDMVNEKLISKQRRAARDPQHSISFCIRCSIRSKKSLKLLATGLPASPAAVGRVVLHRR